MNALARKTVAATVVYAATVAACLAQSDRIGGSGGLFATEFDIRNAGPLPLSCEVKLAHWYSERLATLLPGAGAHLFLWTEPETGTVYRINAKGDRMPVERLWCGRLGASWDTRQEIAPERHRRAAPPVPVRLDCRTAADGETRCTRR